MNPIYPHDEIAREAYLIYEARGMLPGGDLADWLEAERLCRERIQQDHSGTTQNRPVFAEQKQVTLLRRPEGLGAAHNPFKGKKNRGTREEIRVQVPHPAARTTLDRSADAAGSR